MAAETWLYRHDGIQTGRPYGCDVDASGWLWEGCGENRLTGHNLDTAETVQISVPEMGGRRIYQVLAIEGYLILTLGDAPYYLVYDLEQSQAHRREITGERPIVWYGSRLSGGRALLYERTRSEAMILDGPDASPRVVTCPYEGQLASGWPQPDGCVYSALSDPARLVRFSLDAERFTGEFPLPFPEATLSGSFTQDGVLYAWDTAGGRILPFELETGVWRDPIPTPDYGDLYGFLGGGFGFDGKAYICLSTYAHPSRLDTHTGRVIVPEGRITVDGRPPRFLDRFLVFDPQSGSFEYLVAPEQPDGVSLLCYSWTDGERFAVTGCVIPYAEPGVPGDIHGSWIVLQNRPAAREPGFEAPDINFDRKAHIEHYRRGYGSRQSLYLPYGEVTPPTVNMHGPATHYPPGRQAELTRRAERTDRDAYLAELAGTVTRGAASTADAVRRIAGYVNRTLYYNPIQVQQVADPVTILESHDARCGHGVTVTVALLEALGIASRAVGLCHHAVAEATYDGGPHVVDALFFGASQPERSGQVLSVAELQDDPYFADAWPQACFAYDPELLSSEDGFWVLGYVFGIWGSEPYYSYYLGAEKDHPPTLPAALPAQRAAGQSVWLNWSRSVKMGDGEVNYQVKVFCDRACTDAVASVETSDTRFRFDIPEPNRMYYVEVRAVDGHRSRNPETWYPAARSNFVWAPEGQYGWYGVV